MPVYRVPLHVYVDVEAASPDEADHLATQRLDDIAPEQPQAYLFQVHAGQAAPLHDAEHVVNGEVSLQRRRLFRLLTLLVLLALIVLLFVRASYVPTTHDLLTGSPHVIRTYFQHWVAGEETKTYRAFGLIPVFWMGRIGKFLEFASALVIVLDIINEQQFIRGKRKVIEILHQYNDLGKIVSVLYVSIGAMGALLSLLIAWLVRVFRIYLETGNIQFEKVEHSGKQASFYVLLLGFALDILSG